MRADSPELLRPAPVRLPAVARVRLRPRDPCGTVLVTGAAGFIGSSCVAELLLRGNAVVGLDSFDTSLYGRAEKRRNVRWARGFGSLAVVEADVADADTLTAVIEELEVDRVVHFAGLAGVRQSAERADDYFRVNAGGTVALLDAARRAGVRRFVLASSSSVYGERFDGPFREGDACDRPKSPYAASKRAMELEARALAERFELDVTCLRFFSVYGPRQRPDLAVRRFLAAAARGEKLPVFGDGSATRDFTFVGDAVRATIAAMERADGFRILNVGSARPVSLRALVREVGEVTGSAVEVEHGPASPQDVPFTCADLGNVRAALGWEPRVGLRDGLARTLAWMKREGLC